MISLPSTGRFSTVSLPLILTYFKTINPKLTKPKADPLLTQTNKIQLSVSLHDSPYSHSSLQFLLSLPTDCLPRPLRLPYLTCHVSTFPPLGELGECKTTSSVSSNFRRSLLRLLCEWVTEIGLVAVQNFPHFPRLCLLTQSLLLIK